jgi:nucleotide-binding universal stress UspA family protein
MVAERGPMSLRRILVPLDGSAAAEAALPVASELARTSEAKLLVIRVTDARFDQDPGPMETGLSRIREAEAYLQSIRDRLGPGGGQVATFLWRGSPAAAIVKAACDYQVDMIIMTTHARTGRDREMFGSVAEAVLRGVTVPVLVVRPKGETVQAPGGEAAPSRGPEVTP